MRAAFAVFLFFGAALAGGGSVLTCPPGEVLAAVSEQYAPVSNLVCTVRREISVNDGDAATTMSHVEWARGDRMRVQVLRGGGRRVVIDGTSVYVKRPGDAEPAVYLVENQTPTQFANLRSVPASPEEALAPLRGMEASDTAPAPPYARTVAFANEGGAAPAATLSLDSEGRVARLEYTAPPQDGMAGCVTISLFKGAFEALPGVWLFRRVETSVAGADTIDAISRFDSITVNDEMPDAVFDPSQNF
ncbi:MAG: hypothetical protein IKH04_11395 [Kiritimatiellae bacterium]|nr:hypothetical protein [Kiritimatiellia bacterium]